VYGCSHADRIGKKIATPEELAAEFGPRVQSIGRVLPMLEPWRNPSYLSRAWCLFEMYTAIGEHGKVKVDIILTEEQHADFAKAMSTEGCEFIPSPIARPLWSSLSPSRFLAQSSHVLAYSLTFYRVPLAHLDGCIDSTIDGIHSENATAFSPADLEAIRALIQSKPGGFEQLNSTVKQHLHRWFESQGAVRSGARIVRNYEKGGRGGKMKANTVMPANETYTYAANPPTTVNGGMESAQYAIANGDTRPIAITGAAPTENGAAGASVYEGDGNRKQGSGTVLISPKCPRKQSIV
jgi:hypothetical protein